MSTPLTQTWELFGDFADATQRFTSGATPPTRTLTQMVAGPAITFAAAAAAVTVWDTSTSPVTTFDFLYLAAEDANLDVELTCVSATGTRTFVIRLVADAFPFVLNDDTANFAFSDANIGLITKIRVQPPAANTATATLRFAVAGA